MQGPARGLVVFLAMCALGCRSSGEAGAAPPTGATAAVAPTPATPAPSPTPALPPTTAPAPELAPPGPTFGALTLVTAHAVASREPVRPDWRFARADGFVWAHVALRSTDRTRAVEFRWTHAGNVHKALRVHVGQNPHWRTWDFLKLTEAPAGEWTVEIVGPLGERLARTTFWVTEEVVP